MTASTGAPRHPAVTRYPPIPLRRRLYGFGSIYGKTIRDSRLSFIIAAGMFGGMALVLGTAIGTVFPTPEVRKDLESLVGGMPASMVNLFGNTTLMGSSLGTLGGWMTFKYGALFALGTALWSILALSGTLAGEASHGSLDFVAASPFGKRRIALEKLAAHLTVVWLSLVILAVMLTISSSVFGDEALGDQIPLASSFGFAAWIAALALFFGGLAFALAPMLGRAGSAGVSALVMMLLWVANGLEVGGPLIAISPFYWMNAHVPLVGLFDWPGVVATALVGVVFLVIGVELFNRRDLGVTAGLSLPSLPAGILGVRGPISRAFGDQLTRALSWGIGMAIWGALLASLVGSFTETIGSDSQVITIFGQIFPGYDFTTAGAWLQLYAELFLIAAGFAAATFVAKWASDETSGRLELVLSSPLARAKWVVAGGISALLAVLVMTMVYALGVGLGAASADASPGEAVLGSASLGLVAAAFVGIGVAVGGLWRTSLAAEITAVLVVATYLIDLLAPPLNLPDWFHQLALTAHLGQPMIGDWDPVGIVACLALAVGGIALGAWGMTRRDVAH
jgi:polyether ionophore transport system permease protein